MSFLHETVTLERTKDCLLKWLCMTDQKPYDWIDDVGLGLDTCASRGEAVTFARLQFYDFSPVSDLPNTLDPLLRQLLVPPLVPPPSVNPSLPAVLSVFCL